MGILKNVNVGLSLLSLMLKSKFKLEINMGSFKTFSTILKFLKNLKFFSVDSMFIPEDERVRNKHNKNKISCRIILFNTVKCFFTSLPLVTSNSFLNLMN